MTPGVIVRLLGPMVDGVQTFPVEIKFASLTIAITYLQSTIDQSGYCLMVTNLGIPWCDRWGTQHAYIINDPAVAAELAKEEI